MFFEMNLSCIRLLFTNPNIKQTEREENFLLNLFYGGYSMNLFQNVKYGVSCREAAERYGVSVNRQGKALCPFHNDRHPSLYVADNHYFLNLSNKLQRESLRYVEAVQLADALGYEIVWQRRK